jgi:hypothetical protein
MSGIRSNLCWCTWSEDSNRVESAGPLGIDLKVSYDLVLRFLDLDQLAKLVGLARFPFANNFHVRFEHAHELSWRLRVACENPYLGYQAHWYPYRDH